MDEREQKKSSPAWWQRLGGRERKLTLRLAGILLVGLALMYGSGLFLAAAGTGDNSLPTGESPALQPLAQSAMSGLEEDMEQKLLRILTAVEGAGQVQVALSFRESGRAEYALNSQVTESSSEEQQQQDSSSQALQRSESLELAQINEGPVLVKESMPLLQGAVIVAEGAGDPYVREKLHKAARILLGLPSNRIEILKSE